MKVTNELMKKDFQALGEKEKTVKRSWEEQEGNEFSVKGETFKKNKHKFVQKVAKKNILPISFKFNTIITVSKGVKFGQNGSRGAKHS